MHDSIPLPTDRRRQIAHRLAQGQSVSATALAQEFHLSEDAIRRDLRALAAQGLCRRVYGGALPLSPAGTPISVRAGEDGARKRALASAAVALLRPGQTIFLDAGSTTLHLAGLMPAGLTVVTHSLPAAAALMHRRDLTLITLGGRISPDIGAAVDAQALAGLAGFRFDLCFLGACALSLGEGLAGFDLADATMKRALLTVSRRSALMMTNAKLETAAPYAIAPLAAVSHYFVEQDCPAALVTALRSGGAEVTLAPAAAAEPVSA